MDNKFGMLKGGLIVGALWLCHCGVKKYNNYIKEKRTKNITYSVSSLNDIY